MLVKIVTFFLIGMAVLAMFGRLRLRGKDRNDMAGSPRKCPACGSFIVGKGPCACGRSG